MTDGKDGGKHEHEENEEMRLADDEGDVIEADNNLQDYMLS